MSGGMTQRRSLQKVTTDNFADGGYLNRQQFNEFFLEVQDSAQILDLVRFEPVNAPKGQIDKLGVGERLMRSAAEATSGDSNDPQTGKVEYNTEKVEIPWEVSQETVEDTIEGDGTADRLVELFANQFSVDTEDLGANGDETFTGDDEEFVTINDGWITEADGEAHMIDGENASIDKSHFSRAYQALPARYGRNPEGLRWLMSHSQRQEYKDYLTDRNTAAGDAMLMTGDQPTPYGIPIETPVNWPDDKVMLVDPQNLVWIVQRDAQMRFTDEGEAVVRRDLYGIYNMLARMDYVVEDTNGIGFVDDVAAPEA